jgi:hypothetical protein
MISSEQINQVANTAGASVLSQETVDTLRSSFPDIHFTYCMDDDVVSANPVYESDQFNLYLIDSSNHCLSFTQDLELATGIVVAELEEE